MLTRRISTQLLHSIVPAVFLIAAAHAGAAEQVFDVDETTSTFSTGSVEVEFDAVAHGTGWLPQYTSGTAVIENAVYQADGTITLDSDASTVTLQNLQIGGNVGAVGSGELDWGIFTMQLSYEIISRALSLNAPLTVPLTDGAFSATPNFEFSSVLDGHVAGLLVNYDLGEQQVNNDGDMPVSGTLTTAGPNLLLDLTASQLQIDLGGSPTVTVDIYQCAVRVLGICYFFMETSDVTITSMTYNDVQMSLAASSPLASVCGDGALDPGEDCDDGNTDPGDCCSPSCEFEPSDTVCRTAAGVCDIAETCTGSSADCPADGYEPGTTVCRASAGVCDVAETCTGSGVVCPADAKLTSECRASVAICDIAESCDGVNANCPADAFAPVTTECRAAAGVCDGEEYCDGASAACPPDFGLSGVPCPDGDLCNGDEMCDLGVCLDGTPLDCDNGDVCDGAETCDPVSGCQSGTSLDCDDGDRCTADSCDAVDGCINDPIPGCGLSVPSMSGWGMALLSLALLAVGGRFLSEYRRFRD